MSKTTPSGNREMHTSDRVLIKTEDGMYLCGDAFWPETTDNIIKAARHANLADAKKYLKTAEKRLKPKSKLTTVVCEATFDANFNVVSVKEKEKENGV